ncbi:hypothetical protein COV20_05940 [Candidatus Woesearchaeota archaeon CG10_big_fil_rev_8_21_14_0_10_45_16]|nr:MAG: hypothetical protein COV20_05940 [Candidatus Woesearchaeota archaeon CG10_big_fil_rev_8_21_14_0_10_45_16]
MNTATTMNGIQQDIFELLLSLRDPSLELDALSRLHFEPPRVYNPDITVKQFLPEELSPLPPTEEVIISPEMYAAFGIDILDDVITIKPADYAAFGITEETIGNTIVDFPLASGEFLTFPEKTRVGIRREDDIPDLTHLLEEVQVQDQDVFKHNFITDGYDALQVGEADGVLLDRETGYAARALEDDVLDLGLTPYMGHSISPSISRRAVDYDALGVTSLEEMAAATATLATPAKRSIKGTVSSLWNGFKRYVALPALAAATLAACVGVGKYAAVDQPRETVVINLTSEYQPLEKVVVEPLPELVKAEVVVTPAYEVAKGDSYCGIGKRQFGDGTMAFAEILKTLNGGQETIHPGDEIYTGSWKVGEGQTPWKVSKELSRKTGLEAAEIFQGLLDANPQLRDNRNVKIGETYTLPQGITDYLAAG